MKKNKQRYIDTTLWDKSWFRGLSPHAQLLYMYLLTNPLTNLSGIYEITDDRMGFDVGIDIEGNIRELVRAKRIGRYGDWVVIIHHPDYQKWDTNPQIALGLFLEIQDVPKEVFEELREVGYTYPAVYSSDAWRAEYVRLHKFESLRCYGASPEPPFPLPSNEG